MSHTPGPWRIEKWSYENGKRIQPTIQTDDDAIAQVLDLWCPDDRAEEREANARLIAAAPALLAALETLCDTVDSPSTLKRADLFAIAKARNDARAAIRQAKGEGA